MLFSEFNFYSGMNIVSIDMRTTRPLFCVKKPQLRDFSGPNPSMEYLDDVKLCVHKGLLFAHKCASHQFPEPLVLSEQLGLWREASQ